MVRINRSAQQHSQRVGSNVSMRDRQWDGMIRDPAGSRSRDTKSHHIPSHSLSRISICSIQFLIHAYGSSKFSSSPSQFWYRKIIEIIHFFTDEIIQIFAGVALSVQEKNENLKRKIEKYEESPDTIRDSKLKTTYQYSSQRTWCS